MHFKKATCTLIWDITKWDHNHHVKIKSIILPPQTDLAFKKTNKQTKNPV